jgi:translation elongation factor EF-Tu-like GTPase
MADAGLQAFRMTIEAIVAITGRPGVHLGGEIESGVVRVGDRLDLLDGGELVRVARCLAV